jgi:hypothetical protein
LFPESGLALGFDQRFSLKLEENGAFKVED